MNMLVNQVVSSFKSQTSCSSKGFTEEGRNVVIFMEYLDISVNFFRLSQIIKNLIPTFLDVIMTRCFHFVLRSFLAESFLNIVVPHL